MKKFTLLKMMLLAVMVLIGVFGVSAETYSHTITSKTWSKYGDQTLSGIVWNASATNGGYWAHDKSKGQQFGSGNNPAKTLTLASSDIPGIITSVKISTSGASSIAAKLSVSVGGTSFTINEGNEEVSITSTNKAYEFAGSASGEILINWNQTSSKALYVKAIEVTYAIPSFDVTAIPNNSELGTVSTEGAVITAVPSACVGYENPAYTIVTGEAVVTQSGDVFTVNPSSECTIQINFAPIPNYTVTLNPGSGTLTGESELAQTDCESPVDLPAAIPCGEDWVFEGWSTAEIAETEEEPLLILSGEYLPNDNVTLYAVYSKTVEGMGNATAALTSSELAALNMTSAYNDPEETFTNASGVWAFRGFRESKNSPFIQIRSNATPSYIKIPELSGNIKTINLSCSNANNNNFSGTISFRDGEQGNVISSETVDGKECTIDVAGDYLTGYITASGACRISSISVTYTAASVTYNSNPVCTTPKITIEDEGGAQFTDVEINKNDEGMLHVIAEGLTEDMTVEITGTDAALFTYELAADFNQRTGGIIFITYSPLAIGTHTAALTITSGTTNASIDLSGTAIDAGGGVGFKDPSVSNLYAANGQIHFHAAAGENIEIYDAMGKRIYQGLAVEGLNSIAVKAGIVMVKVGDGVSKVIVK